MKSRKDCQNDDDDDDDDHNNNNNNNNNNNSNNWHAHSNKVDMTTLNRTTAKVNRVIELIKTKNIT